MSEDEFVSLVGNFSELMSAHTNLLASLEEMSGQPQDEQRVGSMFLTLAPYLKSLLLSYCSNHPQAVIILEKYK